MTNKGWYIVNIVCVWGGGGGRKTIQNSRGGGGEGNDNSVLVGKIFEFRIIIIYLSFFFWGGGALFPPFILSKRMLELAFQIRPLDLNRCEWVQVIPSISSQSSSL